MWFRRFSGMSFARKNNMDQGSGVLTLPDVSFRDEDT